MMKIKYNQYSSIPLKAYFIDKTSGQDQNIIFNVPAGTVLSSSTAGIVKFSVFNGGTNTIANSTLNGSPVPLSGLYMTAQSSSSYWAVYQIQEGLTGLTGINQATQYDISGYYRLTDINNITITELPFFYSIYVTNTYPQLDPRND